MTEPQEGPTAARSTLLRLASERGASLASLSDMIGRNASYLQQYIRKGSPRRLEERDRRVLAQFFGVAESKLGAPEDKSSDGAGSAKGRWVDVPRLALGASAGPGSIAAEEIPFDSFRFSRKWLREHGLDPASLTAIAVAGDSMEPLLRDRDEILVDRTPAPLRDGVYVVRLGDALHVKRVQQMPGGAISLISENTAYAPIEVAGTDLEIVGRVVWKAGRL